MVEAYPKSVDVFIAGGGPAGLATAIAARRHGMSVLVADGAVPPIDKPCGEGLMPDGVEALAQLGVTIPEGEAFPFRGIRFVSDGRQVEAQFPFGAAYGIRRTNLHRIMVGHAAESGVAMLWQASVNGLHPEGALISGHLVRARWIVGADGSNSRIRQWAGLDLHRQMQQRFAFRRHYRVRPWTEFMELHWGRGCQLYVTPVSEGEVCVALISSTPKLRLEESLREFPALQSRLQNADHASTERGAITVSRKLQRVSCDRVVLVGDASGGVDAITGEGLCLAFRQSAVLAECLAAGDLSRYQVAHGKLARRPALMAQMMLLMGRRAPLRQRVMRAFETAPDLFGSMLAMHVGEGSSRDLVSNGLALGWNLLRT
jgi:menaquinone-9 beta-reductase